MKLCSSCKIEKPRSEFSKRSALKDGLRGCCKQCDSNRDKVRYTNNRESEINRARVYYSKNAEARRLYQKKRHKENPEVIASAVRRRRARLRNLITEKYTVFQMLEKYGTNCNICGLEIDLNAPRRVGHKGWETGLHIDHLIPISKGGPDTLDNVRPAHGLCNLKKPR